MCLLLWQNIFHDWINKPTCKAITMSFYKKLLWVEFSSCFHSFVSIDGRLLGVYSGVMWIEVRGHILEQMHTGVDVARVSVGNHLSCHQARRQDHIGHWTDQFTTGPQSCSLLKVSLELKLQRNSEFSISNQPNCWRKPEYPKRAHTQA